MVLRSCFGLRREQALALRSLRLSAEDIRQMQGIFACKHIFEKSENLGRNLMQGVLY